MGCVSETLFHFGRGDTVAAPEPYWGPSLLGIIYFLMAIDDHSGDPFWFGLFERAVYWAGRRIYPILQSFDSSGRLGPLIFILAFLLLSLVASAVQLAFFFRRDGKTDMLTDDAISFAVRVQPRASKSGVVGELDGALKIRLAAPPG